MFIYERMCRVQLALLESVEEGNVFLRKNVPRTRVDHGTAAYEADLTLFDMPF